MRRDPDGASGAPVIRLLARLLLICLLLVPGCLHQFPLCYLTSLPALSSEIVPGNLLVPTLLQLGEPRIATLANQLSARPLSTTPLWWLSIPWVWIPLVMIRQRQIALALLPTLASEIAPGPTGRPRAS